MIREGAALRRASYGARLAAALIVHLLGLPHASADGGPAEDLFREGRRLLDAGEIDAACSKLDESQRMDPSSGTLINLALCHEKQGRLATARAEYFAAAGLARDQGREERALVAEGKAAELVARVPRLNIGVREDIPGMVVTRDGAVVPRSLLFVSVELDPGTYTIAVTAAGRVPYSVDIVVVSGETRTIEVPPLAQVEVESRALAPGAGERQPSFRPKHDTAATSGPSGLATAGWIVAASSVASLGVGIGFGIASLDDYREAEVMCPERKLCSEAALDTRNDAEVAAWVANVGIGVGVVGAAVGAIMILTSQPSPRTRSAWAPSARGAGVVVAF